jgi:hypothetical protein
MSRQVKIVVWVVAAVAAGVSIYFSLGWFNSNRLKHGLALGVAVPLLLVIVSLIVTRMQPKKSGTTPPPKSS